MSRDLDDRLSHRKADAVKEWLDSNKMFHVMRDHPGHHITVLAGMWGIKLNQNSVREAWKTSWDKAMNEPLMKANATYGADQRFLRKYVLIDYTSVTRSPTIMHAPLTELCHYPGLYHQSGWILCQFDCVVDSHL